MNTSHIIIALALGLGALAPAQEQPAPTVAKAPETAAPHPFFDFALYPRWSQMSAAQALTDIRAAIDLAEQRKAAIKAVPAGQETFDNTFGAFEGMDDELQKAGSLAMHLSSTMDQPALRKAMGEITPMLAAFESATTADADLWQVIKRASQQPWVSELSPEKQRYVKQVTDHFRENGADFTPEQKARKAALEAEHAKLMDTFDHNVLDSTNAWKLVITDPAQLKGMSEDWMHQAAARALEAGYGTPSAPQWLVTLDDTSAREVLRTCEVEATRKACWEGMNTIGNVAPWDNEPVVARIMELRRELSALLGYGNYCDLMSAHRMIDNSQKAQDFIYGMMEKVKPAFDRECREMLDYIGKEKGEHIDAANPWDVAYYARKMAKETYSLDPEELRPYQSFDNVRNGMFKLFSHLYDISITEVPTVCLKPGEELPQGKAEVWHPEVKLYAITDNKTGAHLGSFYLDPFPRPTKRAGAWVMPMAYGASATADKPHGPHLATLCGNMSAPVGDKPALFTHYDAETLFHEFGHMMHAMLGNTELRAHEGTNVAWDFVEMPSQMNENWTWEPESMALFQKHYLTGEPIPADLQEKLIKSRFFRPATDIMGQLNYARLDFDVHCHYDKVFAGKSLDEATSALLAPWRMPTTVHGSSPLHNITHCISGGYAAGYYCYKWAEVLQADAFSRFRKEGVLNPATGAAYREAILSKGDSKPAAELFRDFMGRDPNTDALLEEMGIEEEKK